MISMDYVVNARYDHMVTARSTIHAARPPKRRAALLARRYARRRQVGFGQREGRKGAVQWYKRDMATEGVRNPQNAISGLGYIRVAEKRLGAVRGFLRALRAICPARHIEQGPDFGAAVTELHRTGAKVR